MAVDLLGDVAYLDTARAEKVESPAGQLEALRTQLATERSAGKAMLVAVLELECRLENERRVLRDQRLENERLWADLHGLDVALRQAERPLWRKLLRRR